MVGVRSPQKSNSTPLSRLVPVTRGRSSPRASARATWRLICDFDSPVTLAVSAANSTGRPGPRSGIVAQLAPLFGCSASQIAFLRLMACARCEAGCSGPGPRRVRSACAYLLLWSPRIQCGRGGHVDALSVVQRQHLGAQCGCCHGFRSPAAQSRPGCCGRAAQQLAMHRAMASRALVLGAQQRACD